MGCVIYLIHPFLFRNEDVFEGVKRLSQQEWSLEAMGINFSFRYLLYLNKRETQIIQKHGNY
ncbi:hypothetical protein DW103_12425 [Parabacteroides sp. AM08-6]|nr:hypothetical protein DW103_12425 [Parabacteroides sp. AM08-6]